MEIVLNLRFVDDVMLEDDRQQKIFDVAKYDAKLVVLGSDSEEGFPQMPEYQQVLKQGCEVILLPRIPEVSTTQIKKKIKE